MIKIATIKDIAERSQVSVATVSHVINRTRFVSNELIKRVEKAMVELDYQPNLMARSLRNKKTGTVGLIIPDSSNAVFAEMAKKIEDALFDHNYNVIVCNSSYDINRELEYLNTLRSKMVDGILIVPGTLKGEHLEKFKSIGIPVILLDRSVPDFSLDAVLVDNYKGGYDVAKYLLDLGHREIGYIDRVNDLSHSMARRGGFNKALDQNNIPVNKDNFVRGGFRYDNGVAAARKMLHKNPSITAVFCFNDINALGAIRGLNELGLKVPQDVSVVGFDNTPISAIYTPSLTTVRYPITEMAVQASNLLLRRIGEPIFERAEKVVIATELVIRESTASR